MLELDREGRIADYTPDPGVELTSTDLIGKRLFGDVLVNLDRWQTLLDGIWSHGTPVNKVERVVAERPSGHMQEVRLIMLVEPAFDRARVLIGPADGS